MTKSYGPQIRQINFVNTKKNKYGERLVATERVGSLVTYLGDSADPAKGTNKSRSTSKLYEIANMTIAFRIAIFFSFSGHSL